MTSPKDRETELANIDWRLRLLTKQRDDIGHEIANLTRQKHELQQGKEHFIGTGDE